MSLATRMDNMETALKTMSSNFEIMSNQILKSQGSDIQVQDLTKDNEIDGINVMTVPSRDAYSFGLQLMDMMFTKDELEKSLLFPSAKSDKPALDKKKVQRIIALVNKRYGDKWNIKTLTAKANQKCRDAKDK